MFVCLFIFFVLCFLSLFWCLSIIILVCWFCVWFLSGAVSLSIYSFTVEYISSFCFRLLLKNHVVHLHTTTTTTDTHIKCVNEWKEKMHIYNTESIFTNNTLYNDNHNNNINHTIIIHIRFLFVVKCFSRCLIFSLCFFSSVPPLL